MDTDKLVARNSELESNNRLLHEKLKKKEKEIKILTKQLNDIKAMLDVELKQCESCNHWCIEETMSYVGNELICENCRENGYGR
jgi:predicted RNase H-like nuclease (RuvC/YqgF family)